MNSIAKLLLIGVLVLSCRSIDIYVNGVKYVAWGCQMEPIFAGQTKLIGTAQICNDDTKIYLNINLVNGYTFAPKAQNVKWNFGYNLDTTSRPIAGQFPFKATVSGNYYGAVLFLSRGGVIGCLNPFIVLIHLDVAITIGVDQYGLPIIKQQTAFVGHLPTVPTKPWFYYVNYSPVCVPPVLPPTQEKQCKVDPTQVKCDQKCGTAYAYGPFTIDSNRWGWMNTLDDPQTITRSIYQSAGNNVVSNGQLVGTATFTLQNGLFTASVNLASNCYLKAWHIYANEGLPSNLINNGGFPYKGTISGYGFDQSATLVNSQPVSDFNPSIPVYVIAHFQSCCIAPHVQGSL